MTDIYSFGEKRKVQRCSNKPAMEAGIMRLPAEIMGSIFLNLSVKTLLTCRCVCRLWLITINSSNFADLYHTSSFAKEFQPLFFSQPLKHHPPINDDATLKVYAVTLSVSGNIFTLSKHPIAEFNNSTSYSHNYLGYGLFLIIGRNRNEEESLFLYNPIRGEKVILPLSSTTNASKKKSSYGLKYDDSSKQYKFIRVTIRLFSNRVVTEAYTFGAGSNIIRKRQIHAIPPCDILLMKSAGVPAYGDIHWHNTLGSYVDMILSFEFEKEEFKVTPLPDGVLYISSLFNWRGKLAVLEKSFPEMNMWVLRDYYDKNKGWEQLCTIPLPGGPWSARIWEDGIALNMRRDESGQMSCPWYFNMKTSKISILAAKVRSFTSADDDIDIGSYTVNLTSLRSYGDLVHSSKSLICSEEKISSA